MSHAVKDQGQVGLTLSLCTGITFVQWVRYLWGNLHLLDLKYIHRIVFISALSLVNLVASLAETVLFSGKIRSAKVHDEPVFIVGHPRTGTTHLHNLLSLDEQFGYVDTFQVAFPNSFLTLRKFVPSFVMTAIERFLIDDTRPMDGLPLNFSVAAEDEIAVNMMTGGISPYAALSFIPRFRQYLRFVTFEHCTEEEIEAWTVQFLWFLKKVSYACGNKPLVIKSPVHMGRTQLIRKLFPKAKFVFIHRHPISVLQSSCHLVQEYFTYCFLCKATRQDMTEYILEQHRLLYKAYFANRDSIEALCEVSFEELERLPHETVRKVYRTLELEPFHGHSSEVEKYLGLLGAFKKNDHAPFELALQDRILSDTVVQQVMNAYSY